MGNRLDFQKVLEGVLGSHYVYFQPPSTDKMTYPCIVYNRSDIDTQFAGNRPYIHTKQYTVTVIDKNPDSLIPDKIAALPRCSFSTAFKIDQLNHDVFSISY